MRRASLASTHSIFIILQKQGGDSKRALQEKGLLLREAAGLGGTPPHSRTTQKVPKKDSELDPRDLVFD